MFSDEKISASAENTLPVDGAPAKRRARTKKPPAKSAGIESDHRSEAPKKQAQSKRGPGRPKGSKNKFTLEREKIQKALDKQKLGPTKIKGPMRDPKDILIEAANFWWTRAEFLSDHARTLADIEADAAQIDATMAEADRYLTMACKAAEQASPYFHPRVSGGLADSDVVAYVARLPAPADDSDQWARESNPNPSGHKRTQ